MIRHISEHGKEALKHLRGRMDGSIQSIPTPWRRYNDVGIDGIEFNSITLIGAMSGNGKTVFANQIAGTSFDLAPELDHLVLDFNFEMLGKNLVMRGVSAKMNMSMQHLQSSQGHMLAEEEYMDIENYVNTVLCKKPYYIVDEPTSWKGVESEVVKFYKTYNKKFLASLDHSILTRRLAEENSLQDTLQNLGLMFTGTKKVVPIAWLVLTQLNREIEDKERAKNGTASAYPMKSDIFGGDALYQHSDLVTVIHRPFSIGIKSYGPDKVPVDKDTLFFHNLKVRNGDSNILKMQANFKRMRIIDPSEPLLEAPEQLKLRL